MWAPGTDNTVAVVERLRAASKNNRRNIVEELLYKASLWKPSGYDIEVQRRRDFFEDRQTTYTEKELQKRYPETHSRMSPYSVPLFGHQCLQRATFYQAAPNRDLYVGGEKDSDATALAEKIYADAGANHRLLLAEQVSAAAGLAFLRAHWDDDEKRVALQVFWPDYVHVILDPEKPARLQSCEALVAQITSPRGVRIRKDQQRYEVWANTGAGFERLLADADGEYLTPEDEVKTYDLLPWVVVPFQEPIGSLFSALPEDDVQVNLNHNVMNSDLLFTISQQMFSQVTFTGPIPKQKMVMGPGNILYGGEAGAFSSLDFHPSIDPVLNVNEKLTLQHLLLRGVSPSTATADPKYQSGLALRIANMPMTESRQRRVSVLKEMEERQLWQVMRYVDQAYAQDIPGDAALRLRPGKISVLLDDESELRISQTKIAMDMATRASEMVRLGMAQDEDHAEQLIAENREKNEAQPVTAGIPFMRSATVAPRMIIEDGDGGDDGQDDQGGQ